VFLFLFLKSGVGPFVSTFRGIPWNKATKEQNKRKANVGIGSPLYL